MRPRSFILVSIFFLSVGAEQGGASLELWVENDHTVKFGGYKFGFCEKCAFGWGHESRHTSMLLGPFGEKTVSFSVDRGLAIVRATVFAIGFSATAVFIWFVTQRKKRVV